ncbi:hypothetical protein GW17_00059749 [Ensete ventricosum]|nr:hypothetical protein GW17_00059749 [Ensete ventricosum]
MSVVVVEAAVASVVKFLGSSPHRDGDFEESFPRDQEEDLDPGRVERNVGEPGNSMFGSYGPLSLEPWRSALRGFGPWSLLIFALLCHQSLGGDILVGPLQHFRHSRRSYIPVFQIRMEKKEEVKRPPL